ncbi:MAG: valine--tRNA ligase, partial [Clostridia bacterium]|nr:valine--tRNA ligase [Clostridia bacterium]
MEKTYQPNLFERRIYENWERKGYFCADTQSDKNPYTIIMPPPNITGQLHIGHAFDLTPQDCLIRLKRMQGYNALWLPGIDHASIATEVKVAEKLRERGIDKREIGREAFLEQAWEWKKDYGERILEQVRYLGGSCDWSKLVFTLDEKSSKAVKHAFVTLYNKGLIYQGDRIINMCPSCGTALSDAEVEFSEQQSHLWLFKYYTADRSESVTFATTRPETMLGDAAIAVNPTDERYSDLVGKTVIVPFVDREIPIIADDYVEKDFGTGVVKITPAHDPNDFEVGARHNLPVIKVMSDNAIMNELATPLFEGLDRFECRKKITEEMRKLGQLVEIRDYAHNTGECYRCKTTVEPIVSKQWFVKMKPLAQKAIEAVKNGETAFHPSFYDKTYLHWMENIRDWCISRQLWWGHRIPVYYCDDCGEVICSENEVNACSKCGSKNIRQDEDVLDTWFSSALWPFSTLDFLNNSDEYRTFYPTNVLVTGYDIIPFWVARMIFCGLEFTGKTPFKDVLIHGLVRDEQGRKMSKSLGNGIDPIELIEKYGADTLRFGMLS